MPTFARSEMFVFVVESSCFVNPHSEGQLPQDLPLSSASQKYVGFEENSFTSHWNFSSKVHRPQPDPLLSSYVEQ